MADYILGIDIAKATFDVALLGGPQTYRGHFKNTPTGFRKLGRWLCNRDADVVHACMEATNRYWSALAEVLHAAGHTVSVVNPKRIKHYAESRMQRNKTDAQDALVIADYCLKHTPDAWTPTPQGYQALQAMVRRLVVLKADRQRERNRRANELPEVVLETIDDHLEFLNQQIEQLEQGINDHIDNHPAMRRDKELLVSIPGVGDIVASTFIAEVPDVRLFAQARQLAAFFGLTPGRQESGTSRRSTGHLVKWGNPYMRRVLYMPSLSAHCHNPIIANLKERLEARGKSSLTVIVAIMRKLVHLCYGVLKTRKPFDPNHAVKASLA